MTRPAFADILNLAEPMPQIARSQGDEGERAAGEAEGNSLSSSIDAFIAKRRKRKRQG